MMLPPPIAHLLHAAVPVLHIHGLDGRRWTRRVPETDGRRGPWLQARYDVLDAATWQRRGACLYLVTGRDGGLRYVGVSRNGLKHRWRTSPALDAASGTPLPGRQLFHSQCWRPLQAEVMADAQAHFRVHCLGAPQLLAALHAIEHPIAALAALGDDGEIAVDAVERWICNHASDHVARWNVAMTGRR